MSDWNGQESGVASALAGLDMTMPGDIGFGSGISYWGGNLTAAVLNGTVPQWRIDDMVVRILAAFFKVGRDEKQVPINFQSWTLNTTSYLHQLVKEGYGQVNWHVNVQDDHKDIIREIGGRSTVLLKNVNDALPLDNPSSIAVIGEDAHPNPGGPNACFDRGCDDYTLAVGWGSGTADFPYLVAPVDALRAQAAQSGSTFTNFSNNYDHSSIVAIASKASVAVVFVNADAGEGYITVDVNEGDRNNLTLWQNGDALITEVSSVNPNTIVVIHSVGPVIVEDIKNNPNVTAILWAGIPGQESGNAITDVLYGRVNPSAKSVFTWGKNRTDWGSDVLYDSTLEHPQVDFTEGIFIDYRYFDKKNIEPSYEFGYGLSYTTFAYSNLRIRKLRSRPYQPSRGYTQAAPTFGAIDFNVADYGFPAGFTPVVTKYIYPYLSSVYNILTGGGGEVPPGSQNGGPQPILPAGGSAGGNNRLYDGLYKVSATITNRGHVDGIEVAQLVS